MVGAGEHALPISAINTANAAEDTYFKIDAYVDHELNDWKSKSPRRAQLAYANSMAMSVVVHQKITKSGGIPRGAKGYRQFRYALGSKKFGNIIRTATDKFDFNKPDKSAKAAAKSINDAIRKNEIETTARSPTETLEDVKDKILNAAEELTKGDTEKKFQVLVKNKDLISDIDGTCDQINALIGKYERGQRKSKRGGKKSRKTKRGGKKSRKTKRGGKGRKKGRKKH